MISAYLALRTAEQTGDSSAALRMTCFAIAIVEMYPSFVSPYCHPEEDVRPARESSAGRLTKDLLRHRLIPSLLGTQSTQQAARLRTHGQAEVARVLMGFRNTGISTSLLRQAQHRQ